MLVFLSSFLLAGQASTHKPDTSPLYDSGRTISAISRTSFLLQYATTTPCETKVEIRQGDAFSFPGNPTPGYRVAAAGGSGLWHTTDITGLKPGKRYYYRVYDPGATPTSTEAEWGAVAPWSREYAVSTEASAGRKTIIHLPVKVLLMPNVVNVDSAVQPDGSTAPDPPKITPEQLALIENEYRLASRVFWVNSGMRLWVDFRFVVDDRWQRWGQTAPNGSAFFQNLPLCRSYAGADYVEPGGGKFTFVDAKNPAQESSTPVGGGYACQIEQAWPRRWDPTSKTWKFYVSGGATQGADDLPQGIPARSQFFAGNDTAWLAANEFHHQLESLGALCLGGSEDGRIVPDRSVPRHRFRRGDGTYDEQAWNSAGPHGEFWDAIRYWDRQISDCQWLRFGFGTTETVVDKDGDGFPDDDPRLPLDAKRFKAFTGTSSFDTALNWDWVFIPLQPSWIKDRKELGLRRLSGTRFDHGTYWQFADEGESSRDPNVEALLGDGRARVEGSVLKFYPGGNGDVAAWGPIPESGFIHRQECNVSYKHCYNEAGYYGLIVAKGPVSHIDVDLDGEGKGMFTQPGALGFTITSLKPAAGQAGPVVLPAAVKVNVGPAGRVAPWLTWKAVRKDDGTLVFEFKVPNGGDGPWYWQGAGHRIGVAINAYDSDGRGYSMGEPYRLYYCRMAETRGREPRPALPLPLASDEISLKPGDKAFTIHNGWAIGNDGVYHHEAGTPGILGVGNLKAGDFDLMATIEGSGELTLGAYAAQTPLSSGDRDYSLALQGGSLSLHVFGISNDSESIHLGPGAHQVGLLRRAGGVWLMVDGKVHGYAHDPNPQVVLTRFALTIPAASDVSVREIRYRLGAP